MVLIEELINGCYLYYAVPGTEMGKQTNKHIHTHHTRKKRSFAHVEVWCPRLAPGPRVVSVVQGLPWGRSGCRGPHFAGGNCHPRTRHIPRQCENGGGCGERRNRGAANKSAEKGEWEEGAGR